MVLHQLLTHLRKRTVARDLAVALAVTIAVVVLTVGLLNYLVSEQKVDQELDRVAADVVERLTSILALPLWNIETGKIGQIAQVYMEKDEVIGLRIVDEEGAVIFDEWAAEEDAIARTGIIRHEGYEVGEVEVFLTRRSITEIKQRVLFTSMVIILLVILAVILVIRIVLQRYLNGPLKELTEGMGLIASGRYAYRLEAVKQADISEIIQAANVMAGAIQSRDEALRQAKEVLEARVERRTVELTDAHEQLKESQAQIVHAEKMASLGQLAAGVAHEINNPIGFVTSNLGTLTEYTGIFTQLIDAYEALVEALPPTHNGVDRQLVEHIGALRQEEDLDFIREDIDALLSESLSGLHRVKEIVQGLKSFARLDEAEMQIADVNDGIKETLKVVWNELKYKAEVRTRLGDLPRIRCYPGQLNQVFMNLLINAAQAIPEHGEITVETEAVGGDVVIRVSDTGVGIPPDDVTKLFNPFFTTKPVGQGTGLGLSISYGIIQEHEGRIEVESEVGQGTTFSVYLPAMTTGERYV